MCDSVKLHTLLTAVWARTHTRAGGVGGNTHTQTIKCTLIPIHTYKDTRARMRTRIYRRRIAHQERCILYNYHMKYPVETSWNRFHKIKNWLVRFVLSVSSRTATWRVCAQSSICWKCTIPLRPKEFISAQGKYPKNKQTSHTGQRSGWHSPSKINAQISEGELQNIQKGNRNFGCTEHSQVLRPSVKNRTAAVAGLYSE